MTKRFITSMLVLLIGSGIALAQRGDRQPPSVDEQVKRLADRLNLTSDQQSKIKPILEDQRQQMASLREDSSMSREDRMSKMRSIRESTNSKISEILNDDQKKQYEAMQHEMRSREGRGQRDR